MSIAIGHCRFMPSTMSLFLWVRLPFPYTCISFAKKVYDEVRVSMTGPPGYVSVTPATQRGL